MDNRPINEGVEVRHKGFGTVRKRIFHPWRHFVVGDADYQTVSLQVVESLGEHLVTNVGDGLPQILETQRFVTAFECQQKQNWPFAADAGKDVADWTFWVKRISYLVS